MAKGNDLTLENIRKVFKEEIAPVEKRLLGLERRVSNSEDTVKTMHSELHRVEHLLGNLADSFVKLQDSVNDSFREFQSLIQGLIDPIMGELVKNRDEQTLLNGRSAKINQIENEVEKLKKIHPQGIHQTVVV